MTPNQVTKAKKNKFKKVSLESLQKLGLEAGKAFVGNLTNARGADAWGAKSDFCERPLEPARNFNLFAAST